MPTLIKAITVDSVPENQTYKHLEVHFRGNDFGSVFTESKAFREPHEIISSAEDYLQKAYKGELKPGQSIEADSDDSHYRVRFLPTNSVVDGVSVGSSAAGGRVVLQMEFDRVIGQDAVVSLEGRSPSREQRTLGGRDEEVNIVEGNAPETKTMYIIGGSFGSTGKFGLYTLYPGTYAPPVNNRAYWEQHAFYRN